MPTSVFSYGYGAAEPSYNIILDFVFENKFYNYNYKSVLLLSYPSSIFYLNIFYIHYKA